MSKSSTYNPRVVKTQGIIRHYGWLNREQGPKMDLKFAGESWNLVQRRLHGMEGREGALPPVEWANGNVQWGVMKGALSAFQSGNCVYVKLVVNYPYVGIDIMVAVPGPGPIPWPPFPPERFRYCQDLWDANESISYLENADNSDKQVYPDVGFDILECWKMTCAILWTQHPQHDDNRVLANADLVVWPDSLADGDIADCWDYEEKPDDVGDGPNIDIDCDDLYDITIAYCNRQPEPYRSQCIAQTDIMKQTGNWTYPDCWGVPKPYDLTLSPLYEIHRDSFNPKLYIFVDKEEADWRTTLRNLFPLRAGVTFEKTQHEVKGISAAEAMRATALDLVMKRQHDKTIPRITTRRESADTPLGGVASTSDDTTFKTRGVGEHEIIEMPESDRWSKSEGKINTQWSIGVPSFLDILDDMSLEDANVWPLRYMDQSYRGELDGVWRFNEEYGDIARCKADVLVRRKGFIPAHKLEFSCLTPTGVQVSYRELQHTSWANSVGGVLLPSEAPSFFQPTRRNMRAQRVSNGAWIDATAPGGISHGVRASGIFFQQYVRATDAALAAWKQLDYWISTTGQIGASYQYSPSGSEDDGEPTPIDVTFELSMPDPEDISTWRINFDIPYQKWYLWTSSSDPRWATKAANYYAHFGVKTVGLWDE